MISYRNGYFYSSDISDLSYGPRGFNSHWHWSANSDQCWHCLEGVPEGWYTQNQYIAATRGKDFDRSAALAMACHQTSLALNRATTASSMEAPPTPSGLSLMPYQVAGVSALKYAMDQYGGAILADDCGTGKGIQTIGLINSEPSEFRKVLILCPYVMQVTWQRELEKWLVSNLSVRVARTPADAERDHDILIVNYDKLGSERMERALRRYQRDLLVLDEAHYVRKGVTNYRNHVIFGDRERKNHGAPGLAGLARHCLPISGTPLMSCAEDLWPLLRLASPVLWSDWLDYSRRYCDTDEHLEELSNRLYQSVLIRRTKDMVLKQLPARVDTVVTLPLDKDIGQRHLELESNAYAAQNCSGEVENYSVQAIRISNATSKLKHVVPWIKQRHEADPKAKTVVFAFHRKVAEQAASMLKGAEIVTGSVSGAARQEAIDRFQNSEASRVFVATIGSMGVGVTLTAADTVIFLEHSWNPGDNEQAADRCHRIGQKNTVVVRHIVYDNSVDARIAEILQMKKRVAETVVA